MLITFLLRILLYASPKVEFSDREITEYEDLISTIGEGELLSYNLSNPKYRFLQYLSLKGSYLFHGSNNHNIELFEPRNQTLFNGKPTQAVFASSEPIWSTFYSVFNRSSLVGGGRNGCIVCKNKKYHYYSLNDSTIKNNPWTEGMLYILPKNCFVKSDSGKIHFDEWISHDHVKPAGRLIVNIDDFYFKNKVATHNRKESMIKTWLLYKVRTLRANPMRASNSR
ncbi:hypothetical protein [Cohnella caldifontis]|uniref:hypothetical protein n=1 Tax=Cohnella caldifontis TaxID=3027471 RepID=UPI0023EAE921|nr:hypothetical protein [Cohnella sp. YIM B05605]